MSKTSFAEGQLKSLIERIERLDDEKKAIAADIREVKAEAKANGFDVKIINAVLSLRKKDAAQRMEEEAMLDLYLAALGMLPAEQHEIEDRSDTKPTTEIPSNDARTTAEGPEAAPSPEPSAAPIPDVASLHQDAEEAGLDASPGSSNASGAFPTSDDGNLASSAAQSPSETAPPVSQEAAGGVDCLTPAAAIDDLEPPAFLKRTRKLSDNPLNAG